MKVLFVTFHYPPFNAVAGLRASKLTRYLLELGVDVRVLTADRDDLPGDLAIEIPEERVVRTSFFDVNILPKLFLGSRRVKTRGFEFGRTGSPLRLLGELYRNVLNFPDGQVGWYRPAVRAGELLMRDWRPDVLVSVASPRTSHLVGHALAKRHRIPWVAEYQDPWTDARTRRRAWPLSVAERMLEEHIMRNAQGIVAVSDAWAQDLHRRFPQARVDVVPCGFDPADYGDDPLRPQRPLTLAYTGRLYERQDPLPLFEATKSLLQGGDVTEGDIRVEFFGRYLDVAREALRQSGLGPSLVRIEGPIPYADAVRVQQRSHVLLLFLTEDDDVGCRPAKLYEYLAARRPILVMGGTSRHEAARIVAECGAGVHAHDAEDIAGHLSRWVRELGETGSIEVVKDSAASQEYAWPRLARSLLSALEAAQARGAQAR